MVQAAGRPLYRNSFTRGSYDGSTPWFNPFDLSFKNVANTGVLAWAGQLYALWEVRRSRGAGAAAGARAGGGRAGLEGMGMGTGMGMGWRLLKVWHVHSDHRPSFRFLKPPFITS